MPASATIEVASGVDPALVPVPIPETVPEMLAQLKTRNEQVRQFIDKGMFAAIYVPAFQAKDLALALDEHKKELPPEKVKIAEPAIARLVRSAYLLDAFGDLGNKQQIVDAYARFNDAVGEITLAFPGRP
jgi:predicted transcriptional regulator